MPFHPCLAPIEVNPNGLSGITTRVGSYTIPEQCVLVPCGCGMVVFPGDTPAQASNTRSPSASYPASRPISFHTQYTARGCPAFLPRSKPAQPSPVYRSGSNLLPDQPNLATSLSLSRYLVTYLSTSALILPRAIHLFFFFFGSRHSRLASLPTLLATSAFVLALFRAIDAIPSSQPSPEAERSYFTATSLASGLLNEEAARGRPAIMASPSLTRVESDADATTIALC